MISPCVFRDGAYLGSLDEFTRLIREMFDLEINNIIHNVIPFAEKRVEQAKNQSDTDYVKMGFMMSNDSWKVVHYVTFEIFPKLLPKSCSRFMKLCKGQQPSLK